MNKTYETPQLVVMKLELGVYGDYCGGNDGGDEHHGGGHHGGGHGQGGGWWH